MATQDDCYMTAEAALQLLRKSPAVQSVEIVMGDWHCIGTLVKDEKTGYSYRLILKLGVGG